MEKLLARGRQNPLVWPALLLAALSLHGLWAFGDEVPGMDFYAVWVMAQNAGRDDLPNPYSRTSQDRMSQEMRTRIELAGNPARLAVAAEASTPLQLTATPFLYARRDDRPLVVARGGGGESIEFRRHLGGSFP